MPTNEILACEQAFKEEISLWENRYEALQREVQQMKVAANMEEQQQHPNKAIDRVLKQCDDARLGLKTMNDKWSSCLEDLAERVMNIEQYSRKGNLILKGLLNMPELYGLDFIIYICDVINNLFPSLRGFVQPIHIDDAHPLSTKKGGSVVIVKFANRWIKHDILRCKYDLEGTHVNVTEHLTDHTLKLLTLTKELVGPDNAWTYKANIYAKYNGLKYKIKNYHDLESLNTIVHSHNKPNKPTLPTNNGAANDTSTSSPNHARKSGITEHHVAADLPRDSQAIYLRNYPTLLESLVQADTSKSKHELKGTSIHRDRPYTRKRNMSDTRRINNNSFRF